MINLKIPGKPIAKQRPRFCAGGKTYDKQSKQKKDARCMIMKEMGDKRVLKRMNGPLDVEMTFHTPIPSSWSQKQKKRVLGEYNPKKPDLDNYIKFYLDVMNGLVYSDDNQVVELHCVKKYSDKPRTEIKISEVNEDDGI